MAKALRTHESSDDVLDSRDWRLGDITRGDFIVSEEHHGVSVSIDLTLMEGFNDAREHTFDHQRLELGATFAKSVDKFQGCLESGKGS
jgi:hypothetical protein